ncbi:hypothetical protein [Fructobacillus cardui]|uniref:hypothetical protein n=1 Tax=Fructobacillus cardui TaxID=2893170 RepID=UPI00200A69B5|nr:hypothetical protein [Fructobacillus cardui]MCK8628143.1 hypothetical protein [Fructobacillus cardui]
MKQNQMINKSLQHSTSHIADIAEKQANRISNIANASRVPNFTKSFAGIASVGNTATYMVVFLLSDTR